MITIENVSFSYQDAEADGIQNVSLHMEKGECLLLCGRSGCGKSTLTRLINGLVPHFYSGTLAGSVRVAGMDITQVPMHVIGEKVGSVFQNPRSQFFNVDTDSEIVFGLENLAFPVDEIRRRFEQTTRDLKLEKILGRSIFKLSGGEKQKIAFASVYALSPDVYVLDEPSSNLDVHAIAELSELLKMLKHQGKTIVIAEHRLYYLKDIVDRIVYLEKGRIAGEYTGTDFLEMSSSTRASKGLRAMDLMGIQLPAVKAQPRTPVLEIRDVTLNYDKTIIMKDIQITASYGDIIGVIGKNGAGKSTFSQTLCGLHKEFSGFFLWNGSPMSPKQRLKLSYMVKQDVNYQLFAASVEEECSLGSNNPDEGKIEEVLKGMSLYEYRQRHPMSLSGGQKQRTAVAVSQLCNKKIIIFDEPTSGLDFGSMVEVSKLMEELAAAGKVIFVVTHDYELITKVCNRMICFADGKVKDNLVVGTETARRLQDFFTLSESKKIDE